MTAVAADPGNATPVLSADSVTAGYGRASRPVIRDVSVALAPGRTLGIVGESGSGKSTLAKVLVGLLPPTNGTVRVDGRDTARLSARERLDVRRRVQLVPQDPASSLDPRMSVERTLAEAIDPRGRLRPQAHRRRITELLESVSLDASAAPRLPHEFSGGQRQRIVIARALAVEPQVIVADEVTSSLDVSIQAEILDLLGDLQRRLYLGYVFITHDLAVAQQICTDLSVLYLGRVIEQGSATVLAHPDHPYTELLRDSVPDPNGISPSDTSRVTGDDAPDPTNPPPGCSFHPRCPYGPVTHEDRTRCSTEQPVLSPSASFVDRQVACHFPLGAAGTSAPESPR